MLKSGYNVERKDLDLPAPGDKNYRHKGAPSCPGCKGCSNQQPPEQSFGECRQWCPQKSTLNFDLKSQQFQGKSKATKLSYF